MQQEGFDFTQQRLCNQWPGAAGSGGEHGLLAVLGGGRHHAFEPEHRHQDVTALRPVEGLLSGWLVTCRRLICVAKVICWWCNLTVSGVNHGCVMIVGYGFLVSHESV